MKTRLAIKEDIEKIKDHLRGSWLMHASNEPEFINREAIEQLDLSWYFEDCLNGSDKSYLIIADEDGEIAGCAKINIDTLQKFFNETTILYIDDIYTMEKFRGKGVAKLLLQESEKLAKEKDIKWLKARVYSFNEAAQKTFRSAGFKHFYSECFKILK